MAELKKIYRTRIRSQLEQAGGKAVPYKKLYAGCKGRKPSAATFAAAVAELTKRGRYYRKQVWNKALRKRGSFPRKSYTAQQDLWLYRA